MAKATKKVTLAEAQEAAANYQKTRITLSRLEAQISEDVSKVRSKHQPAINAANESLAEDAAIIKAFAEQEKDNWKKKSFDLTHCVVSVRTGSRRVVVNSNGWEEALQAIKANRSLKRLFLVTTESIDKKAILSTKDEAVLGVLAEEAGVTVERDEETISIEAKEEIAV